MTMYRCEVCSHVTDSPEHITEAEVYQDVEDGLINHPDDLASALEDVGTQRCPECSSPYLEEVDG